MMDFFFCFGEVRWRTIVRSSSRLCVRCIERGLNRAPAQSDKREFLSHEMQCRKKSEMFPCADANADKSCRPDDEIYKIYV
jgi:hypothetical protein